MEYEERNEREKKGKEGGPKQPDRHLRSEREIRSHAALSYPLPSQQQFSSSNTGNASHTTSPGSQSGKKR